MMAKIRSHRDLEVYQLAFEAAMEIFEIMKGFLREEVYSLTDQIRRYSRSVCANLAEAWRRRRYEDTLTFWSRRANLARLRARYSSGSRSLHIPNASRANCVR